MVSEGEIDMRISACVITKNEEQNLPAWLDSMGRIADEMIVVDTGSTDGTLELAKAAGAKVAHFKWVNDFAAAKNYAIEQAHGDWIVFLDADEYFQLEDCPRVRETIERYHSCREVAGLMFLEINIERETGQNIGGEKCAVRAFRNVSWIRYDGEIHEALRNTNQGMKIIQYVKDVVIYHTGYSKNILLDKYRRNLEILLHKENKKDTDDYYLADCYYNLGQYEDAIRHLRKLFENKVKISLMENAPYTILILSLMYAKYPADEIYEVLKQAVRTFPDMAEFRMLMGWQDWDLGNYIKAEKNYLKGIELYQREKSVHNPNISSNALNFLPTAYMHLGEIAVLKGDAAKATECFVETLKLKPRNEIALKGICRLLRGAPVNEVICLFDTLYDRSQDGAFLAGIFAGARMGEAALYYEERSGRVCFDSIERCILERKFKIAAEELVKVIRSNIQTEVSQ